MPKLASMSRRGFTKLLGAGAAYVAVRPSVVLSRESLPRAFVRASVSLPAVRLNSNENPYGPSQMALKAMTQAFDVVWRYPDETTDVLLETVAKVNGVTSDQVMLGNGSGEILKLCAAAFTGPLANERGAVELSRPTRGPAMNFVPGRGKLVVADPTFEAILNHARVSGAEIAKVPLTNTFTHDLPKMIAAASEGLIFICNPNNPTASITPKGAIRDFISKVPKETMILVDEAYFHYADSPDYESVIPLVKDHPNLIVARTFSKIYGMAGLRCGYCIAQRETIQRMRPHQTWDSVNVLAAAAAIASLSDSNQVSDSRRLNTQVKRFVLGELDKMGYQHIPSQANFIMVDVKRPVREVTDGLRQQGIYVGRLFPPLPTHMRVTIGKQAEMERFITAFRQVTKAA